MGDQEDYLEVSPNEILHRESRYHSVVKDSKIQTLPIEKLPWEDFEEMALRLFNESLGELSRLRAFRYGGKGFKQQGLDLVALNSSTSKYVVAECKNVSKVTTKILASWVDRFLTGKKVGEVEKFILITTYDLGSNPNLVDQWHKLSIKLYKCGISAEVWDFSRLTDMLRHAHSTVEIFYGYTAAENFCLRSPGLTKYPSLFNVKKTSSLSEKNTIENRSIRLDMFLPTEKEPHLSGAFSFAKVDLNGFTIALDSEYMVSLMQYRAHSGSIISSPFLHGDGKNCRCIFALPHARITLDREEVLDIDWVILRAWELYIDSAEKLDKKWRTTRFKRHQGNSFSFDICKIEKWFWQYVKLYIQEFDCDLGDTEHHIFDAAGCIKVYVPMPRSTLDSGYHLIMYAQPSEHIYSTHLTLTWEPLTDISGKPIDVSPRRGWDAEYAHNWLFDYLFQRVYERFLCSDSNHLRGPVLSRVFRRVFSRSPPHSYIRLKDIVYSCANISNRNIGYRVTTQEEAVSLIEALQRHFHVYTSKAPIEPYLIKAVIKVCRTIISTRPGYMSHYFNSNLKIAGDDVYGELVKLEEGINDGPQSPFSLDLALRSLYALLSDLIDICDDELLQFSENVLPLWQRYIEDLLCKTYY